jgi:membrane-bound acyltransferase YfiQ involved in biofilm formation
VQKHDIFAPLALWISHLTVSARVSWLAQESAMSFGIYAVGYLILIAGIAYLAHLMHVPERYIIAVAIILFGIGVVTGVQSTRNKDPN